MFGEFVIFVGMGLGGLAVLPVVWGEKWTAVGAMLLAEFVIGIGVRI